MLLFLIFYLFELDLSCIMWDTSLWCMDSNCATRAQLICSVACGILIPQPGVEPESPALQSESLTTGPAGKSQLLLFLNYSFTLRHTSRLSAGDEEVSTLTLLPLIPLTISCVPFGGLILTLSRYVILDAVLPS